MWRRQLCSLLPPVRTRRRLGAGRPRTEPSPGNTADDNRLFRPQTALSNGRLQVLGSRLLPSLGGPDGSLTCKAERGPRLSDLDPVGPDVFGVRCKSHLEHATPVALGGVTLSPDTCAVRGGINEGHSSPRSSSHIVLSNSCVPDLGKN